MLGALDALFRFAEEQGLTENGRARVIQYMVGTLTPEAASAANAGEAMILMEKAKRKICFGED